MTKALEYISSALQRNTTKFFVPAKFLTQEDLILINRQILTFKGDYLREIRCPDCGSKVAIEATSGPDGEYRYTYLCTGCDCLEDRSIAPQEVDLLEFNFRSFRQFIDDPTQSGEYVDEAARCLPFNSTSNQMPVPPSSSGTLRHEDIIPILASIQRTTNKAAQQASLSAKRVKNGFAQYEIDCDATKHDNSRDNHFTNRRSDESKAIFTAAENLYVKHNGRWTPTRCADETYDKFKGERKKIPYKNKNSFRASFVRYMTEEKKDLF